MEDDKKLGDLLLRALAEEGFNVDIARDGEEGSLFMADRGYDCVILDRMIPNVDGDSLLKKWRCEGIAVPILMLTALSKIEERVVGLDIGADDYMVKPFAISELLARVRALIRRTGAPRSGEMVVGGLILDLREHSISYEGQALPFTNSEFRMVALLARNAGKTVPRQRIIDAVWEEPWQGSDNALEAHVKNVRRKLRSAQAPVRVKTVRGIGYRMEQA